MSHSVSIEEAAHRLRDLIAGLGPNDEITVTASDKPVARIVPPTVKQANMRRAGALRGMIKENPDVRDDAHLDDFKDYM